MSFIEKNYGPITIDKQLNVTIAREQPQYQEPPTRPADWLPRPNSYIDLADWLKEQKEEKNIDWLQLAGSNLSKMCRNLLPIIGWVADPSSLRKYQHLFR